MKSVLEQLNGQCNQLYRVGYRETNCIVNNGVQGGALQIHKDRMSVYEWHGGESGIRGMCRVHCLCSIVFDQCTTKITLSLEKGAFLRHKCSLGLKDSKFLIKRFGFRKKEKTPQGRKLKTLPQFTQLYK